MKFESRIILRPLGLAIELKKAGEATGDFRLCDLPLDFH